MAKRDFVEYHIVETLRAEMKLWLICMSDEELWGFAKLTSSPPERPVKLVYKGIKQAIEEIRATASEWVNQLVKRPTPDKEGRDDR